MVVNFNTYNYTNMKLKYISLLFLTTVLFSCSETIETDIDEDKDDENKIDLVEYTETLMNFTNPERGFYRFHETSTRNSNVLTESFLTGLKDEGISLVYNAYTMPDFRDKPISEEYMSRIITNMEALRENGLKSIVRFRYTNSESDLPWDAPQDILFGHIEQLKPIFEEYADVIAVLEAGFIGVWGEWYYTEHYNFRPNEDEYGPRREVLDALLDALPKERMVLVRYPAAKLFSFDISYTDTVSLATAYNQSDLSRVGFHNDCFLADQDDRGTFGGNRNYRRYWQWESKYLPMGGETCSPSSFSECNNALEDMADYHWSFLNMSYHPGVINDWLTNNCMDEIKRRLGYRFVLNEGSFTNNLNVGEKFEMDLKLMNIGFAAPYNPRNAELILVSKTNQEEKYVFDLGEDPRYWFGGEEFEIKASINVTEQMKGKQFDVCLNFPDPQETLSGNPDFSIRLANEDVWNPITGYNKIHTITIK